MTKEISLPYREVFDTSLDLLGIVNKQEMFEDVNQAFTKTLGHGYERLTNSTFVSFIHPEDQEKSLKIFRKVRDGGTDVVNFECRFSCADGTYKWLQWNATKARDSEYVLASARDITSFKEAFDKHKESQQRLELILNSAGEGIFGIDTQGNITFVNSAGCQMVGYSEEELLGKSHHALVHYCYRDGSDYPEEQCNIMKSMKSSSAHREDNEVFWRRDGTSFDVEYTCTPIGDSDDKAEKAVIVFRDISERKRTEHTLQMLHAIASERSLSIDQKIQRIIALGVQQFGVSFGVVSQIEDEKYHVEFCISPNNEIEVGQEFNLLDTYCSETMKADRPLAYDHIGESDLKDHPCYLSRGIETYLGAAIIVDGIRQGTLSFYSQAKRKYPFTNNDLKLLQLFAAWVGHEFARAGDQDNLEEMNEKLEQLSITDELTNISNRRHINRLAEIEFGRAQRYDHTFILMMLDADHFKVVNDKYGHEAGDIVLKFIAKSCCDEMRDSDYAGRFGGEEFVLLLTETPLKDGLIVAERIRQKISEAEIDVNGKIISCTVSIGMTDMRSSDSGVKEMMARADKALYQAKERGRNQVVVFSEDS